MTPTTPSKLNAHVRAALQDALAREWIDASDLRLVDLLASQVEDADADALAIVAAALCRACAEGGLCLSLNEQDLAGALRGFLLASGTPGNDPAVGAREEAEPATLAARFLTGLAAGRFAAVLGLPEAPRPLMRAGGNLYFHRHWFALKQIADGLRARMAAKAGSDDTAREAAIGKVLRETLVEHPLRPGGEGAPPLRLAARQKWALAAALRERVFVLSGGPGTGKTTWTASWLRALLRLPGTDPGRVRLCAPTGRGAQRLQESLRASLEGAPGKHADADAAARDLPVTTLHTLLGYQPYTGRYARGPGDPLDADWVLVDEASMVDVFLLAALVRALPGTARLILVGDADQLPPVEAGSVLGELLPENRLPRLSPATGKIIGAAFPAVPGEDILPAVPLSNAGDGVPSVMLDVSHRAAGEILPFIAALRTGDADGVIGLLGDAVPPEGPEGAAVAFGNGRGNGKGSALTRITAPESGRADAALAATLHAWSDAVYRHGTESGKTFTAWLDAFRVATREEEPRILEILWKFVGRARVLAPLRRGTLSAANANRILRARLEPLWQRRGDAPGQGFHGAPVLVTRNDPGTGLSNGEIGLWLEDGRAPGGATVFFLRPELPDGWLRLPISHLPAHEPGFAVTVHKSQGSEYDEVLVILPESGNRLLARETLYTAATRARRAVRIFGTEKAIREAVHARLRRTGGMREFFAPTDGYG